MASQLPLQRAYLQRPPPQQQLPAAACTRTTVRGMSLVPCACLASALTHPLAARLPSLLALDPLAAFFCYYASLVHQQNMLQDMVRTGAYHSAIVNNASDFAGKVVVDVGTGSGVLAYFAVRAGARHVYALEASGVAQRAKTLLEANGLGSRITVLQAKVEEAVLPEQADIIISEPMGFMLIHERMLESYIIARQRFLKPGGLMFPSRGTIHVAPFTDPALHAEQCEKVAFWRTTDFFGLDLSPLLDAARRDHFGQPVVGFVDPASLLSPLTATAGIDFAADSPQSLHLLTVPFSFTASRTALCHGLATWFDVTFTGSTEELHLRTGPTAPGTHWYQVRILLPEPVAVNAGQRLEGELRCTANARYSYDCVLRMSLAGSEATTGDGKAIVSEGCVSLADQMYSYGTSAAAAAGAGAGAGGAAAAGQAAPSSQ
jgi:histone-arginine methyltransferase CARM1